ncbi:PQQ-binding-like beta-propeller repeat protein, partial [Bacteroidota bacterium]
VFVESGNSNINEYDFENDQLSLIATTSGITGLDGIDFDNDGHIYVSSWGKQSVIKVIVNSATEIDLVVISDGHNGPADIFYNKLEDIIVVPNMNGQTIDFINAKKMKSDFNWIFSTNERVFSSPVIDINIVFAGSCDSFFYAINANTGAEIWKYKTNHPIKTNVLVVDTIVICVSGDDVFALNKNNGAEIWKSTTDDAVNNFIDTWDYHNSSPALKDSVVYYGSNNGKLMGYHINTGQELYNISVAPIAIKTTPVFNDNLVFIGDWHGVLYAIDLDDNQVEWSYDVNDFVGGNNSSAIITDPIISDSLIYFAGRGQTVFALKMTDGSRVWSHKDPIGSWISGSPSIADSILIIGGSDNRVVLTFNKNTGERYWSFNSEFNMFTKPLVIENNVIIVDGDAYYGSGLTGNLYILDLNTGLLKKQKEFSKNLYSTPVKYNNNIILGSDDGKIYSMNIEEYLNKKLANTYVLNLNFSFTDIEDVSNKLSCAIELINYGSITDSILIEEVNPEKYETDAITYNKSVISLAPNCTGKLTAFIDPSKFEAGKTYNIYLKIKTINSMVIEHTVKIKLSINEEDTTSYINSNYNDPKATITAYPNPFQESVTFNYRVDESSMISLNIMDITGKVVSQLNNKYQPEGNYSLIWHGKNNNNQRLAAGYYIYSLTIGEERYIGKIIKE